MLSEGWLKAIKKHQCFECRSSIDIGIKYYRQSGVDEYNEIYCYKSHKDCLEASNKYKKINDYMYYDEYYGLFEEVNCPEDKNWLVATFPMVAKRLGIVAQ